MAYNPDKLIRKALSLAKANNQRDREIVYEQIHRLLERQSKKFTQNEISNYQARLTKAIKNIENEIINNEFLLAHENIKPEHKLNPVSNSSITDTSGYAADKKINFLNKDELNTSKDTASLNIYNFLVGLLCGLLLAVMTYYFFLKDIPSFIGKGSLNEVSVVFNSDFKNGIRKFRDLHKQTNKRVFLDSKTGVVTAKGQVVFHGKKYIPIKKENTYLMRVSFKNSDKNESNIGAYIGFSTYDAKKRVETQKPGKHRYFVISNSIPENRKPNANGWYSFEGLITGVGNTKNAFRETTVYAKPVVILNFKKPDAVSEIKSIEIINLGFFE